MRSSFGTWFSVALVSWSLLAGAPARAEDSSSSADESSALGFERTPPRLSFTDGQVSYWRPGAEDWTEAQLNTPLAAGDELSTGKGANLELQIGARAFARAGEDTQLGLSTLEPDYLQLRLANGTAALDVRELPAGQTLEINTPNAAFTIERPGYFRIEVSDGSTKLTSRRGGRANVTTETGLPEPIGANEQIVVTGKEKPVLATYAAPEIDDWDRWNYGRSEEQVASTSSRYVPDGVYGVDDLDRNGSWQVAPTYGAVWVPRVAVGWAPYSTGTWVADPYYGWTWVDDAPWGWAPFHYGRWVYVNNYWAWSPGPRVVQPYYSPALVAFYSSPSVSISVGFPIGSFGWVALGWGEPVVPWWGPSGCHGVPHWSGWGGPHVVNNVTVHNNYYVNANDIHHYQHEGHQGAMVTVDRGHFGHGHVQQARLDGVDPSHLAPVHGGDLGVRADHRSLTASDRRAARPSREVLDRPVVTRQHPGAFDASGPARQSHAAMREARNPGSQSDRARNVPPPVQLARAEVPERRSSVSGRERGPASASRERVAPPAPPQRADSPSSRRERAAHAPTTPTRERGAQPRAPEQSPARSAPTRSRTGSRSASPAPPPPRSQPRSERAAPMQHRDASSARTERTSSRSSAPPSRTYQQSARPERQQSRERTSQPRVSQPQVSQPRSSPAPSHSGQTPRGGGGGGNGGGGDRGGQHGSDGGHGWRG